uniref:Uncharacterized protein n=1 Tax=Raoultella ornithinolytica TaxID=54291 RepID=A0A0M3STH9_RAOOR|nr:hypothetical protein [Raoultella ornithinolytica]
MHRHFYHSQELSALEKEFKDKRIIKLYIDRVSNEKELFAGVTHFVCRLINKRFGRV